MNESHVKKQRAVFSCMHCSVLTDMIMFVRWRIPSENKLYVHKKLVNILYVRTHVRTYACFSYPDNS